jgi:hypothetical protein
MPLTRQREQESKEIVPGASAKRKLGGLVVPSGNCQANRQRSIENEIDMK